MSNLFYTEKRQLTYEEYLECHNKGMKSREIAEMCGFSRRKVENDMHKLGIRPKQDRHIPEEKIQGILKLYDETKNQRLVAETFGVNTKSVRKILEDNNVPIEPKPKKRIKEHEKAELVLQMFKDDYSCIEIHKITGVNYGTVRHIVERAGYDSRYIPKTERPEFQQQVIDQIDKGRNVYQTAKDLNISTRSVRKVLELTNTQSKNYMNTIYIDEEELKEAYKEHQDPKILAQIFGCTKTVMVKRMKEFGLPTDKVERKDDKYNHKLYLYPPKSRLISPEESNMRASKSSKFKCAPEFFAQFTETQKYKMIHDSVRRFLKPCEENRQEYEQIMEYFYYDSHYDELYKRCMETGKLSHRPSLDHIIPLSLGGSSDLSNLQVLCHFENISKGKLTMEGYLRNIQVYYFKDCDCIDYSLKPEKMSNKDLAKILYGPEHSIGRLLYSCETPCPLEREYIEQFKDQKRLRVLIYILKKSLDKIRTKMGKVDITIEQEKAYLEKFYYDLNFIRQLEIYKHTGLQDDLPSLDHIHSLTDGGEVFDIDNLQFLSWFENRSKNHLSEEEYEQCKLLYWEPYRSQIYPVCGPDNLGIPIFF